MTTENLEIHSENILPIIKKALYSDRDIFVRELVSNACDAIYKTKILRDRGEVHSKDEDFRIDIAIDKDAHTLTFTDTGIGMNADEVRKYIAQIAFSGAEDFAEKYKSSNEKDQIIGHFGLGFYSAYMAADKVALNTLSYAPGAEAVFWSCDGSGSQYTIDKGTRKERGTEVILYVNPENDEFLDEKRVREILDRYCAFLPYPIYLNGQRINEEEPLWVKPISECTEQDYKDFYHHLYPTDPEPLFWVHLNVDYPFHLKGILYFPKIRQDVDFNKNTVKLFCNRVFVSDNCKDIIPNYLMALKGVIDSPDIPLNVSRSYLQMDRTVRQLSGHISKKVSDSLSVLYKNERTRFLECWKDVSVIVKFGCIEDEKFYERSKEFLVWRNSHGEWVTVEDYLEKNREKTKDKIYYTRDEQHGTHFSDALKAKGIEVLIADSPIDSYVIDFLERKMPNIKFCRVDSSIDEALIDTSREKVVVDADGRTDAAHLVDFVKGKLGLEHVDVEAKSLAIDHIPGVIVIDEQQRRFRDYMLRMDPKGAESGLFSKRTFVVNTNSKLMESIRKLDKTNPELAADLVKESYELALLSQREMDPSALNEFVARSNRVLEKLAENLVQQHPQP